MRLPLTLTLAAAVALGSGCNAVVRNFGDTGGAGGQSSSSASVSTGQTSSGSGGMASTSSAGTGGMGGGGGAASSSSSGGGGIYCTPPFSPIAQWLFSGNPQDTSGNGHNGAIAGGAALALDRHGLVNAAYNFDGTTGVINVPDAPDLNGMKYLTVSAWVYADTAPDSDYVVRKQVTGFYAGYTLRASGGKWLFGVGSNLAYAQAPTPAAVGVWTQLVGTYDGKDITLYVNGAVAASVPSAQPPGVNTEVLTISGTTYFFDGRIDDVLIYSCALSAAQVTAAYKP